jgi:hypothetical protein
MEQGSFFPTSSPTFDVVCVLVDNNYTDWSEVKSCCSFVCISFITRDIEHFFVCLLHGQRLLMRTGLHLALVVCPF